MKAGQAKLYLGGTFIGDVTDVSIQVTGLPIVYTGDPTKPPKAPNCRCLLLPVVTPNENRAQ